MIGIFTFASIHCKLRDLDAKRRWKDFKIILRWLSLFPSYAFLVRLTGRNIWRRAVTKYPDNRLLHNTTFRQMDVKLTELYREVFTTIHSAHRPVGMFVEDPVQVGDLRAGGAEVQHTTGHVSLDGGGGDVASSAECCDGSGLRHSVT